MRIDGTHLSLSEKVLKVCKYEKIKTLTTADNIVKALQMVFVILGISKQNYPNENEFTFLIKKIKENLSDFAPEEIILAFELAVNNKFESDLNLYDKSFSLNYLTQVLLAYRNFRFDVLKKEKQMKQTELFENHPPKEIQEQRLRHGTLSYFRLYRDNCLKNFDDYGNARYNYLDKLGVIPFTTERKNEIKKQAIEKYRTELVNNSINISKPQQVRDECKKILKNFDNLKEENRITSIAKEMALKIFFDELKELDEDLETMVKAAESE